MRSYCSPYVFQVAEILKDRPSWFRDCRAVDVLNVLPTANGGTIELLYMQVNTNCDLYMMFVRAFYTKLFIDLFIC